MAGEETLEERCARLEAEASELREERAATVALLVPLSLMCAKWRSTIAKSAEGTSVSLATPEGHVEWTLGPDEEDLFPMATSGATIAQSHRERCDRLIYVSKMLATQAEQTKRIRETLPTLEGKPASADSEG